jgi:hypothetical protein
MEISFKLTHRPHHASAADIPQARNSRDAMAESIRRMRCANPQAHITGQALRLTFFPIHPWLNQTGSSLKRQDLNVKRKA